jgi:hypothetical protein
MRAAARERRKVESLASSLFASLPQAKRTIIRTDIDVAAKPALS